MMIKPMLYLAVYATTGVVGLVSYEALDNNEQPIIEIKQGIDKLSDKLANTDRGNEIYRWQDANGAWIYGDKPPSPKVSAKPKLNYDLEADLALMRSLPNEVLPVRDLGVTPLEKESNFTIPGLPDMQQVKKLLTEATNIQGKMDTRKQEMDRIIEQQTAAK